MRLVATSSGGNIAVETMWDVSNNVNNNQEQLVDSGINCFRNCSQSCPIVTSAAIKNKFNNSGRNIAMQTKGKLSDRNISSNQEQVNNSGRNIAIETEDKLSDHNIGGNSHHIVKLQECSQAPRSGRGFNDPTKL